MKIGSYPTLGFCNNAEEWTKAAIITTVLVGLITVNWIALKGKRAVAEAQRKQAMKSPASTPRTWRSRRSRSRRRSEGPSRSGSGVGCPPSPCPSCRVSATQTS